MVIADKRIITPQLIPGKLQSAPFDLVLYMHGTD